LNRESEDRRDLGEDFALDPFPALARSRGVWRRMAH
jgi:hypothetical protein